MYKTKKSRISFERVSDAVGKHLGFRSNAFLMLSESVRFLVRTRLACRSYAFGFSFERIWLLIRTRFEHVQSVDQTCLDKNALYLVSDGNFSDPSFVKMGEVSGLSVI